MHGQARCAPAKEQAPRTPAGTTRPPLPRVQETPLRPVCSGAVTRGDFASRASTLRLQFLRRICSLRQCSCTIFPRRAGPRVRAKGASFRCGSRTACTQSARTVRGGACRVQRKTTCVGSRLIRWMCNTGRTHSGACVLPHRRAAVQCGGGAAASAVRGDCRQRRRRAARGDVHGVATARHRVLCRVEAPYIYL